MKCHGDSGHDDALEYIFRLAKIKFEELPQIYSQLQTTPLLCAIQYNRSFEVIQFLVDFDSRQNSILVGYYKQLPVAYVSHEKTNIQRLLIREGTDLTLLNKNDLQRLRLVIRGCFMADKLLIQFLRKRGFAQDIPKGPFKEILRYF